MKTVLVVEDSATIRSIVSSILAKDCGFNVIEAVNGADAMSILDRDRPSLDAAVLDIMMQGHGGTMRDYLNRHEEYKDTLIVYHSSLEPGQVDPKTIEGLRYFHKGQDSIHRLCRYVKNRLH